jgi:anti-anti-sigma factor
LIISFMGSIGALEDTAIRDDWANVLDLLETARVQHAIIDLGKLEYFGSIVLELLVVLWKRLSGKGGKLALCKVSPVGLEILHIAKFDTIWQIVPGVQDAMDVVRE